jgi:DNA topoisomerase 2-associated protein PAT1
VVNHLFHIFAPYLWSLFPSSRIHHRFRTPTGVLTVEADLLDQPTWKFLATFALNTEVDQQGLLVSALREKVLDNILAIKQGFVTDEAEQNLKITNVNIFLHALGLDSSQIAL